MRLKNRNQTSYGKRLKGRENIKEKRKIQRKNEDSKKKLKTPRQDWKIR